MDYPHIPMMLSVPQDPWKVNDVADESAANPSISPVDRHIENLCKQYTAASEEQRVDLRKNATNGWSLLHYAHRMANRAMRTGDVGRIRLGLISLLLENGLNDPRETIACLAMLRHAALHINGDFSLLASEAAEISTPGFAYGIQQFVARKPDMQSLSVFGLRESRDGNGPRIDVDLASPPPSR